MTHQAEARAPLEGDKPDVAAATSERTDHLGDPIPVDAVVRLGTVRFRHGDLIKAAAYSPDGTLLATASYDRTARIWDLQNGQQLSAFTSSRKVGPVALLKDRNLLILGNDDGLLQTVDVRSNREIAVVRHHDKFGSLALHPDGELIAAGDRGGKIRLHKINSVGEFVDDRFQPWQAHQGNVYSLAWTADGSRLVSAGNDGRVVSWSLLAASHQSGPDRINVENASSLCLIPRTTSLFTSGQTLVRWNWATGREEEKCLHPDNFQVVTVSPDGKLAAAIWNFRVVNVLFAEKVLLPTPRSPGFLLDWDPGGYVSSAHFSPDSQTLAVRFQPDGTEGQPEARRVWLHRPPNFQRTEQVPVPGARTVAFTPDGNRLALVCDSGLVLWDISQQLIVWKTSQADVSVLAFSPDGELIVSGGMNRTIIVQNSTDGKIRQQLVSHRASIVALAFSPDSATLATASNDGVIKLWHVPTGQELFELRGMGGTGNGLAFAEDGRHLLALVGTQSESTEILVFRAGENGSDE
jgi:WD40 repeat protein